jgi:hypothetical protein
VILSIMGVVTLLAATYIVMLLRHQIADDVRRPGAAVPVVADAATPLPSVADASILPATTVEP